MLCHIAFQPILSADETPSSSLVSRKPQASTMTFEPSSHNIPKEKRHLLHSNGDKRMRIYLM